MEEVRVNVVRRNEQAPRFLEYSIRRLRVQSPALFALIDIETQTGAQADSANDGVVGWPIFMRHDADARRILIDQDMIRTLVGAGCEKMRRRLVVTEGNGQQARHNGLVEPRRKGFVEKSVTDKIRRPGLESAVRELFPSRFGRGGDLGG